MSTPDEPSKLKKKPELIVREMTIDDLALVFHMGEKLFTARDVPNLYRTWDEYEIVELFNSDGELCLVAEVEEQVVGFALGTVIEKSRSAWTYGHLIWLGVAPAHQKAGIGEKLFVHIRALMARMGVRMIIVDTEADNESALRFFQKIGFGKPLPHIYLTLNLSAHKPRNGMRRNHHVEPDKEQ
ncbi:MAG: N-acetyltransferase [Pseudomonadota bacterium]